MVLSSQLQFKQQQPKPQYYLNQPSLVREKLMLPIHYHQFKIQNRQQKLQQQQQQQQRNPIELLKYQQGIRKICEVKLQPQQQHSQQLHSQQQQQQPQPQQQKQQKQQQLQHYLQQFGRAHVQEYCQPSLVREQLKLPNNYHQYKLQNRQHKLQQQQQQKLSNAELLKYQKGIIKMCERRLNISQSLKQLTNINKNNDKNNRNDKRVGVDINNTNDNKKVRNNNDINTNNSNIKKKRNRDNDDENDDVVDSKKKSKL
ncbi:hypothetical protein Glove_19g281 [Diversispora epigaea]|uniref:Uncharacterized protein n=1 Tax=Diversispora epigaea TaxID=1348612 RepID=A0A397JKT7_9GLOM|nr:hypothetical protein Glove_19g281 [Diversispora epigaea]